MPLGRITKSFPSYPLTPVSIKDSSGVPARTYPTSNPSVFNPELGRLSTDAAGKLDFWVPDDKTYTLEIFQDRQLIERISGLDPISFNESNSQALNPVARVLLKNAGIGEQFPNAPDYQWVQAQRFPIPGEAFVPGAQVNFSGWAGFASLFGDENSPNIGVGICKRNLAEVVVSVIGIGRVNGLTKISVDIHYGFGEDEAEIAVYGESIQYADDGFASSHIGNGYGGIVNPSLGFEMDLVFYVAGTPTFGNDGNFSLRNYRMLSY